MFLKNRFLLHGLVFSLALGAGAAQGSDELSGGIFADTMKFAKETAAAGINTLNQNVQGMYSGRYWSRYKKGIERKQAMKTLYKSAENGNAHSQNYIGCIIAGHTGSQAPTLFAELAPAIAKALPWFEKSANQGHEPAIYNLALIKYTGIGTPRNIAEAVRLWESLGEKVTQANVHLAAYFYKTENFEKAFTNANIAASFNDPIGSYLAAKVGWEKKMQTPDWSETLARRAVKGWYAPAATLMADIVGSREDSVENRVRESAWRLIAIGIGNTGLKNRQAAIEGLSGPEAEQAAKIARMWFASNPRRYLPSYKDLLDDIPETRAVRAR